MLAWKGANFEISTRNKIVGAREVNQFCPRIWTRYPDLGTKTAIIQILNREYQMSYGTLALNFVGDEAARFLSDRWRMFIKTASSFQLVSWVPLQSWISARKVSYVATSFIKSQTQNLP